MMIRQIVTYLIAALTHSNHMTVNDLAFFLSTHNFNTTPKDGYVQIAYNGTPCKATFNNETGYVELMFN